MIIQLLIVLVAIIVGARMGGIGLGVMGGIGLMILTFVFGLQPTAPPMDVMLMIAAVIAAMGSASAQPQNRGFYVRSVRRVNAWGKAGREALLASKNI